MKPIDWVRVKEETGTFLTCSADGDDGPEFEPCYELSADEPHTWCASCIAWFAVCELAAQQVKP